VARKLQGQVVLPAAVLQLSDLLLTSRLSCMAVPAAGLVAGKQGPQQSCLQVHEPSSFLQNHRCCSPDMFAGLVVGKLHPRQTLQRLPAGDVASCCVLQHSELLLYLWTPFLLQV
jgi:hypothetical protein